MTSILQDIIDAASVGGLYALFALGIALIFGVAGIVNFAHGELMMIGAYVVLLCVGLAWPLVIVIVTAAVVLAALLMERIAFRPVRKSSPSTLLVVGFALGVFLQNLFLVLEGARPQGVDFLSGLLDPAHIAGLRVQWLNIVTLLLTAALAGGLTLFLRRTAMGTQLRAASEDFGMARLVGIRANRVVATAFAISGVLAAAGAVLLVVQSGQVSPGMGLNPLLIAFIATVIGGMGSLVGAAAGGFLLGALTVALQVTLPDGLVPYRDAIIFSLVIAMLLVRPQGLFPGVGAQVRV
jgi:branched-chain amino acid transport system permease protein